MPYIWSHKVFVFLRLLQIIKGERWGDARLVVRARARTHKASPVALNCAQSLARSLTQPGRDRERRRRSVNIAEFSGIPRIYSSDSDPTVGAGARRVFGLYFHLARLAAHVCAQETLKLGYRNQVRVETTRCPPSSWKDSAAYMTVLFALCLLWS